MYFRDTALALDELEPLSQANPEDMTTRLRLGLTYEQLGANLVLQRRSAEARTAFRRSLEARKQLLAEQPDNADARRDLEGLQGRMAAADPRVSDQ